MTEATRYDVTRLDQAHSLLAARMSNVEMDLRGHTDACNERQKQILEKFTNVSSAIQQSKAENEAQNNRIEEQNNRLLKTVIAAASLAAVVSTWGKPGIELLTSIFIHH